MMDPNPIETVLVVEDQPDTAEMYADMLHACGYAVLTTHGSAAAMSLLEKERPAAVILDLIMPDIPGLEVLGFLRREPELARVPVIIVSGRGRPEDVQAGLQGGASLYLVKPVTFPQLKAALEKVLAG